MSSSSSEQGVTTIDYAKSFHLRFAGNSTVRKKQRPKLRAKREDADDDYSSSDDGEYFDDELDDPEPPVVQAQTQNSENETNRAQLPQHHESIQMHTNEPTLQVIQPREEVDYSNENHLRQVDHQDPIHPTTTREERGEQGMSNTSSGDPDAFRFYSTESDLVLPPDISRRAQDAIEDLATQTDDEAAKSNESCCGRAIRCCCTCQPRRYPGDGFIPPFTPLLMRASAQGARAMLFFLNPSLPRIFRDLWVMIELAVTVYQFFLAAVSLSENHREVFNIVYISIASLALLLSLVDVMLHCVQLGSFSSILLFFRSKTKSKKQHPGYSDPESIQSCCLLGKKLRKKVNNSLELIRNIVSELLLYPLLVCDMFDLVVSGSYRRTDTGEKVNFSLFIVGGFYLVLSVYLARMLMIAFSLYSLRRLPPSANHTQKTYVNLAIKFAVHVMGQMLMSIFIIAAIGIKIRQENPAPCSNGTCISASGFLIYAIIAGGLLPLLGIFSFFFTHAYKIRIMSTSFLVDMVSLLQSESFTSVMFAKEGVHKAKDMAAKIAEKVQLVEVRKELKGVLQATPSWAKRLYPLRYPTFWVYGNFFTLLLLSFIVTLFLTPELLERGDPEQNFSTSLFQENLGLVAILTAGVLIIGNIHLLFLGSILLLLVGVVLLSFTALLPITLVLGIILYVKRSSWVTRVFGEN